MSSPASVSPLDRVEELDLEKAAPREHVILSVSGMNCTGCGNKMTRALERINGIYDVRVTFVSGIVKFNLDVGMVLTTDVITQVEKETGFKCSPVSSGYQSLDLVMTPATAHQFRERIPAGVESVEKLDKRTYRVHYDPTIIGGRLVLASAESACLAPPGNGSAVAQERKRLITIAWTTSLAAVMTIPVVVLAWSKSSVPYSTSSIVSMALASLVQCLAVPEFYIGAIKSLVYSRIIEMNMLIVISITAAYGYSVVAFGMTHAGYTLEQGEFFETSSLLITLVLLGRALATYSRVKATSTISLRSLQASTAQLVQPSSETFEVDARLLHFEDIIFIPPHSRVVTDGQVIRGASFVDESMLTGEALPVFKSTGDPVIAGTINGGSALTIRLTRLPGNNNITDIADQVENALASKPRVQDMADTVANSFVPIVMGIGIVAMTVWISVAVKIQGRDGGGAFAIGITYGIAVLAISCPCAVGLAVPIVLVIAGGVAARSGIIIKHADVTERAFRVSDVVFDKTGTLTKGELEVVYEQMLCRSLSANIIYSLTKSLLQENDHPVSKAVAFYLRKQQCSTIDLEKVESIPGAGIQAVWKKSYLKAGNPYWMGIDRHPGILRLIDERMTLLCITLDDDILVTYGLKSHLREEAVNVVEQLHRRKIRCHIVSGDGPTVVENIAQTVGISRENTASCHMPNEKRNYVRDLMSSGKTVLFCGDGTNDAVAVAQADVGVQIGSASDVTGATADVVLLGGLEGVPALLDISKRAFRRILFNFIWSGIYNLFAILLAGGAFVKVRIPPAYAGLGELVSILPVVIAALTLANVKHKGETRLS